MPQPRHSNNAEPATAARIPLLALHGFTGCGADFQWLARQTADLLDWHTLDFPGHGTYAAATQSAYTPAAVTRSIDAALSRISTVSLPLLLGYSMGGRMALRYLAQMGTEKVRGVILIGASAGLASEADRRERRNSDHALATRLEAEGIDAFMQHWNRIPLIASQSRSPYFSQLQAMRHTNSTTGLARSLRGIGTGAVAPVHMHLSQIKVPCLLLTGAEDAKFSAIAADMATYLPRAQHAIIPNAGHSPHWENPQATTEAIRNWLKG